MKQLSTTKKMLVILVALFVSFIAATLVDLIVMSTVIPAYSYSPAQAMAEFNARYQVRFTVVMLMYGISCATVAGVTACDVHEGITLFTATIVTVGFFIVGSLEDCLYFIINGIYSGTSWFPANNVQWNWMEQYRLFGSWVSTDQCAWSGLLLLVALPVTLFAFLRWRNQDNQICSCR